MGNMKIYRSRHMHFCASSHRFGDMNVSKRLLYTVSQGHEYNFAMRLFDGKYKNLQKSSYAFYASSNHLRHINVKQFLPQENRSRSWSTIFAMRPVDGICQNLQTSFFTFLIFVKVRRVRMIVTHRHTETEKAMAIGEILDLPNYI